MGDPANPAGESKTKGNVGGHKIAGHSAGRASIYRRPVAAFRHILPTRKGTANRRAQALLSRRAGVDA